MVTFSIFSKKFQGQNHSGKLEIAEPKLPKCVIKWGSHGYTHVNNRKNHHDIMRYIYTLGEFSLRS